MTDDQSIFAPIRTLNSGDGPRTYRPGDSRATSNHECPQCGAKTLLVVALTVYLGDRTTPVPSGPQWFQCYACRAPSVLSNGLVQPSGRPLTTPEGLDGSIANLWEEIRACLGVKASNAAGMLCRKLVLHVAYDHGLGSTNERGYPPTFADCIEHLRRKGFISGQMTQWVSTITDIGGKVNHETTELTPQEALTLATFSHMLLVLTYEHRKQREHLLQPSLPAPPQEESPQHEPCLDSPDA